MLQIRTSVVAAANGSRKAVVGSGTTSMSLSWISWKPRIDEPSNPMPSSSALAFTAPGGMEKCCHTPGKSANRRSIIWTFSSLITFRTSSSVAQFGTMASLLNESGALKVAITVRFPSSRSGATRDGPPPRRRRTGSIRHGDARVQANPFSCGPAASTLVRPAHKLHGVFDMPPVFGQFDLALLFEANGVLSGLRNCPGTVCFKQLPRIVVDFDFSHGVTLLIVQCATVIANR